MSAGGPAGSSRREVLAGGALAGTALLLGGCGSSHHKSHSRPNQPPSLDVQLLNRSLDLELETIAAYTAGIPLLTGRPRDAAKQFLGHELSHAGELAGLVKQAGGKPVKARAAYDLGHPSTPSGVLALLEDLERRQLDLHLQALPRLSLPSTRAAVGAVLGSDAQHLALLRALLRQDPIATPLPGSVR